MTTKSLVRLGLSAALAVATVVALPMSAQALNECGDGKVYVYNSTAGPYGNVGGASAACDRVSIQTWGTYSAYPGYKIFTRDVQNPYAFGYFAAAVHLSQTMVQWHASSRDDATAAIAYGNWKPPVYVPTVF